MSASTPPPLDEDQLGIIAAYRRLSAIVAGPVGAPPVGAQIPTRPQPAIADIQPPNGPAGKTTVTITGVELDTADQVFFGDQPVKPKKRATATEVQADVPGIAAGKVKIAVKTSLGTAVGTQDFTVEP